MGASWYHSATVRRPAPLSSQASGPSRTSISPRTSAGTLLTGVSPPFSRQSRRSGYAQPQCPPLRTVAVEPRRRMPSTSHLGRSTVGLRARRQRSADCRGRLAEPHSGAATAVRADSHSPGARAIARRHAPMATACTSDRRHGVVHRHLGERGSVGVPVGDQVEGDVDATGIRRHGGGVLVERVLVERVDLRRLGRSPLRNGSARRPPRASPVCGRPGRPRGQTREQQRRRSIRPLRRSRRSCSRAARLPPKWSPPEVPS
jgi:hypothetical protein